MQVLFVPFAITVFTIVFSLVQSGTQRHIEDQRSQDAAQQAYLDQMSNLLLEKDLLNTDTDATARVVARARTLTVLRKLDPTRKGEVVRFLIEARLLTRTGGQPLPIISLSAADLEGARLWGVDLHGADLSRADLSGAYLLQAILPQADLLQANLSKANLRSTNLTGSQLFAANLRDADLSGALLNNALLNGANLSGADLSGADLSGADLTRADVTDQQLATCASLEGTILPDGSKHP